MSVVDRSEPELVEEANEEGGGGCGDSLTEDAILDQDDVPEETSITYAPRRLKRKLESVDLEKLHAARRRLFADDVDHLTENIFYMEGERIDMEDPETSTIQRKLFARIYNAMLNFTQCKFDNKNAIDRNMSSQAELTERRLTKLKNNGYEEFQLLIPAAVIYILFAMEDIKHIRKNEMIVQLVPITCTIDDDVKRRLRVNGLELRQVNNSLSLSVNLAFDVKFLYAGKFQVKTIPDQGEKHYVNPSACMGNYMNMAVNDLYDLIYDRTKEYIEAFFQRHPEDPVSDQCSDVFTGMDTRNLYPTKTTNKKELDDKKVLAYLLRTVGREINLKRIDLDRTNVFVLTSTLKTKPKYLNAKSNQTYSIDSTPVEDAEAVFLSSFVRARIMEDGSLNFQIYSRACMYISETCEFPTADATALTRC